jgi:dimethylamine--corrinoid protein Co-methyltransferase
VGTGDMLGMPVAHAVASGMHGIRTAGDLVVRLEVGQGVRLPAAKRRVAEALGVAVSDLSDPLVMHEVRGELRLGRVYEIEAAQPWDPGPLEAKANIARLLGVHVNGLRGRGITA